MPSFSSAPVLTVEASDAGLSISESEQLALFPTAEMGDPKVEKERSIRLAQDTMGLLGASALNEQTSTVNTETDKGENSKSMQERSEEMLDSMGNLISTSMNTAVGHALQSKDAERVADPLIDAKGFARAAVELESYEQGRVSIDDLSEGTRAYVVAGVKSGELMDKAEELTKQGLEIKKSQQEALSFDRNLAEARSAYVEALTSRRGILPGERAKRREELARLEEAYNQAFVQRLSDIMDLNPNHRKAPYAPSVMQPLQEEITFENLTGNHLHILADSMVREQLAKAKAIEARSSVGVKKVLGAFKKSRALRVAVGGAIWGMSMAAANKGLLPAPLEGTGDVFNKILPLVAGYVTSREVMSGVEQGVVGFKERREQRENLKALSLSSELGEAALRTIYSNIEYDDVLDRQAGDTPEETGQAFTAINDQFEDLEQSGSRGGKPYSAEQILPIVSELYLERKDQVDAIVESENPKEAFKELCMEMITKDSTKLTERVHINRNKTKVLRALSMASSLFASQFVGMASGLQGASVKPMKWVEKV